MTHKTLFAEKDGTVVGFKYQEQDTTEFEKQAASAGYYIWFCETNHLNAPILNAAPCMEKLG